MHRYNGETEAKGTEPMLKTPAHKAAQRQALNEQIAAYKAQGGKTMQLETAVAKGLKSTKYIKRGTWFKMDQK